MEKFDLDFQKLGRDTLFGLGISYALKSGVFDLLEEPLTFESLMEKSGYREEFLRGITYLLIETGLVEKNQGMFQVSAVGRQNFGKLKQHRYHFETVIHQVQENHTTKIRKLDKWLFSRKSPSRSTKKQFYSSPKHKDAFIEYAEPAAEKAGRELASIFDFSACKMIYDLGGNNGAFLAPLLEAHPHIEGVVIDLPELEESLNKWKQRPSIGSRLRFHAADFFFDPLPQNDFYVSGYILHDWPRRYSEIILKKLQNAVPVGGTLILHENLIDDPRSEHRMGIISSNYAITSLGLVGFCPDGERTSEEYGIWLSKFGFELTDVKFGLGKSFLFFRRVPS